MLLNTFVFVLLICPLLWGVSQPRTQKSRGKTIFPPRYHCTTISKGVPGTTILKIGNTELKGNDSKIADCGEMG